MAKETFYPVRVEFGDCDPAGIVWFPNFFRWIDAASRHFFIGCGVPPWREAVQALGVIGTPLVDTRANFVSAASYGDALRIHTSVRVASQELRPASSRDARRRPHHGMRRGARLRRCARRWPRNPLRRNPAADPQAVRMIRPG